MIPIGPRCPDKFNKTMWNLPILLTEKAYLPSEEATFPSDWNYMQIWKREGSEPDGRSSLIPLQGAQAPRTNLVCRGHVSRTLNPKGQRQHTPPRRTLYTKCPWTHRNPQPTSEYRKPTSYHHCTPYPGSSSLGPTSYRLWRQLGHLARTLATLALALAFSSGI